MEFTKEVDASGLNCPLPILRCKKGLSELEAAQVLKIIATDPGSVKDFNAFVRKLDTPFCNSIKMEKPSLFILKSVQTNLRR